MNNIFNNIIALAVFAHFENNNEETKITKMSIFLMTEQDNFKINQMVK